ncbi:hypothetical protein [Tepidiforma sp.]|uniref:hypothetical protein n=1 Tax=Tepidiforma sp. TaxID=2682230 RepID=UPI002ADD5ACE|nr:hypothetical protein [Tepidiforma sp.]
MSRVLLATIGRRDPFDGGEPTGPLRAARHWRPDAIILLSTRGVAEQTEATRTALSAEFPSADLVVEVLEDLKPNIPDAVVDIGALLQAGRALVFRHRRLLDPASNEVAVCFTSGTPQEGIAMTLVTRSLLPGAHHFQALAPRDSSDPARLLREFDPDVLVHLEARDRVFAALARGDARGAAAAAEPIVGLHGPPWNAVALGITLALARALRAAEDFRRQELTTPFAWVAQGKKLGEELQQRLADYRQWFERCQSDDLAWGAELAASAIRVGAVSGPTMGVIAAAIASEVLIAARLRQLGHDPERLRRSQLDGVPPEVLEQPVDELRELAPGLYRLEGAQRRSRLLAHLDRRYRDAFDSGVEDAREKVARARNQAVHQGQPASEGELKSALAMLDLLADAVGAPIPSKLLTTPPQLERFVSLLRSLR